MKQILKIEELAMFTLSIYLLKLLDISFSWWVYVLLYLAPDIGMIGYIINNKAGAFTYNLFHHKAVAILFTVIGIYTANQYILMSGIILFGHSAMDRMFGYGLKYVTGFKHTHLGVLK